MRSIIMKISLAVTILATASACTQAPAQVELKGQNNFTRNGLPAVSYNGSAPTNDTTSQSAAVQPIGVSDLSAPNNARGASAPAAAPFQRAHPATLAPSAGGNQSFNIRPQGKSAASEKPQMVSDISNPSNTVAVVHLDSVMANEDAKPVTAAITKPVKTAAVATGSSFMWPVASKKIISEFGPKGKGKVNDGINIASADGEPVWAAADGEVVYVGNELQGYGNMVLIKHTGDKATTYAHMSRTTVEKYDRVKQGDIIGYVGTTGSVKEPQLHFAIRDGKDAVDPLKYLDRKVAALP